MKDNIKETKQKIQKIQKIADNLTKEKETTMDTDYGAKYNRAIYTAQQKVAELLNVVNEGVNPAHPSVAYKNYIYDAALKLATLFFEQQHTGDTANATVEIFLRLISGRPLVDAEEGETNE